MSKRTVTTTQSIFTRPHPSAVTYNLSLRNQATIKLPPNSTWTSGPHWHRTHTEYLQILSGHAEITLSGTVLPAVGPADGIITVPRGAVHEWRRSGTASLDRELVVREWTDPADGQKEVFFRNLNGVILDAGDGGGGWLLKLELMNLFWRMDNWPVFLGAAWWPGWVQGIVSWVVLLGCVGVGGVLGCRGGYEEYGLVPGEA